MLWMCRFKPSTSTVKAVINRTVVVMYILKYHVHPWERYMYIV